MRESAVAKARYWERQDTMRLKDQQAYAQPDETPYEARVQWLKRSGTEAGVEQFGFHGIRHLFASVLASENVPLVEIQYMLRHTSLATTQRYIHRLKKENREVLAALPGLSDLGKSPSKVLHGDSSEVLVSITC